jgi:2-dehydro-3-deoxygluconokinase
VQHYALTSAGAELNFAIGMARLGRASGYLTRVGDDAIGRMLLQVMNRESVDHQWVRIDAQHATGMMMKAQALPGADPAIAYFRKHSAASHLGPEDLDAAAFAGLGHLHLTGIFPALSDSTRRLAFKAVELARTAGATISFDPNLRPSLWPSQERMVEVVNTFAGLADWVLPGISEGQLLSGCASAEQIAAFYLARGARAVVIKLGPEGAYYRSAQESGFVPGFPVAKVVDTVGAGDGFAVGVVSALLEQQSLADATSRGCFIGARVVQFPGDCDGLPRRFELSTQPK